MKYRDQKTIIYIAIAVIVIIGMLFGTLYDLEITKALAFDVDGAGNYSLKDSNAFYVLFAILGEWAMPILMTFALSIIACVFIKSKNKKNGNLVLIIALICLLISIVFMAYGAIKTLKQFTVKLEPLHYVVAIFITLVMTFLPYFLMFNQSKENLVKVLPQSFSTLIVGIALIIVVELILKVIVGRLRPYALVELGNVDANFVPWYSLHPSFKDAFRSFPSGHTTYLTFLLSACLFIPNYKLNSRSYFIFNTIMALLIAVMMISRIGYGAHFLSDVAFGLGIGYIANEINKVVYFKLIKKKMNL